MKKLLTLLIAFIAASAFAAGNNANVTNHPGSIWTADRTFTAHITTNTTTTIPSPLANIFVTSIAYLETGSPTAETITIKSKGATPMTLVASASISAAQNAPTTIVFTEPILMTGGMDIITAGTTAGTLDIWITYWQ